ncbi:unnamed protein product [Dibothriocephalus latus]|uniref:Uncharacterized protein n=1 Tax=Dibothriocephalus latus TaxID=60516 RepID=A0A3P7KWY9_DIBLA|nr:unnamed protein product [Dibothriocephalus latus]
MEEMIDKETSKRRNKIQRSSTKVQTENDDIEQLQAMLDIQKLVGRRLQEEADTLRAENELYKSQLDKHAEEQRKTISRQMHFIEQDTSLQADQKATKCFQNELTRLTSDNLTLREQLETTNTHYRKENGSGVINTVNLLSAKGLVRCLEGQEAILIQRLVKGRQDPTASFFVSTHSTTDLCFCNVNCFARFSTPHLCKASPRSSS